MKFTYSYLYLFIQNVYHVKFSGVRCWKCPVYALHSARIRLQTFPRMEFCFFVLSFHFYFIGQGNLYFCPLVDDPSQGNSPQIQRRLCIQCIPFISLGVPYHIVGEIESMVGKRRILSCLLQFGLIYIFAKAVTLSRLLWTQFFSTKLKFFLTHFLSGLHALQCRSIDTVGQVSQVYVIL